LLEANELSRISVRLPFLLINDVHGRILDVVEVQADDSNVDAARRDSFGNLSGSGVAGFRVIDLGVLDVLVLSAFENPHALVEDHPHLSLVEGLSSAGDTDGFIWNLNGTKSNGVKPKLQKLFT